MPAASQASRLLVLFAIIASSWLLYARSLSFPFVIDDYVQIAENPAVTQGAPLAQFFLDRDTTSSRPDYNTRIYRPLRNVAFRGLAYTFGVSPLVFRIANLLLYALGIGLVHALGRQVLPSQRSALLAAGVFAFLPVHVEAVVYPSALGDLLSLDLELLGLVCGWYACQQPKWFLRAGAAAFIFLALAMAAKEMAITGPALLALLLIHRPPPSWRRSLYLLASLGLVAIAYLALRTHVVGQVGQEAITWKGMQRGITEAPALLLGYLQIAVMPLGHRPSYVVATPTPAMAALLILGLAVATWLLLRSDRQQQPRGGLALWFGWFVVALLPVLHLVPLWADLADRFALVSTVGLALAAAEAMERLLCRFSGRLIAIPTVAATALYLAGIWFEQDVWRSDHALWRYGVQAEPESSLAQANYCLSALKLAQYEEALKACDKALQLGRDDAEVQSKRAIILQALGRPQPAEWAARRSLQHNPNQVQMHAVLGDLALSRSQVQEAKSQLQHAHRLSPKHPSTLLLQAALAKHQGRLAEALDIYDELTRQAPGVPRFHVLAADAARAAHNSQLLREHCGACLAFTPVYQPCVTSCQDLPPAPKSTP